MMIMRFRYLRSSYVSIDQWVGVADTTCNVYVVMVVV